MSQQPTAISHVEGRGLPLRGHDLDTDRIMPARFLKAVSFEGLERHLFEDDRAADPAHAFNNPGYAGASILVVGRPITQAENPDAAARLRRLGLEMPCQSGFQGVPVQRVGADDNAARGQKHFVHRGTPGHFGKASDAVVSH